MSDWFRRSKVSPFVTLTPGERVAVLTLLVAMAGGVLPFTLDSEDPSRLVLYGAFLTYLCALGLPFVLKQFKPGVFHPLVFYVIWVGIQGLLRGRIALPVTGLDYHRALTGVVTTDLNGVVAEAFLLDAFGLLSLYVGYALAPKFNIRRFSIPTVQWPLVKSMFWVGIAAFGLYALAETGGGLERVLMQRGIASDQRIAARIGGHWNYLAGIGVVVPLVWLACQRRAIRRPLFWGIVLIALAIKFAATGSRGGTVGPLIMIGAVYVLQNRFIPYRAVLIGIVLALVLIGGLGQYRLATMQAESFDRVTLESGPLDWIEAALEEMQSGTGANSGQLAVVGRVPEQVPHLWGESYLSIPFVLIPSAVWGDKPDAAGRLNATRIYGRPLTAIPPGSVGEAYWNFSYPGIVVVFLLYGALLKLVAALYRANPRHPGVVVLFVFVLFYMQPHSPSLYGFVHAIVPALLILGTFWLRVDGRIRMHSFEGLGRPRWNA